MSTRLLSKNKHVIIYGASLGVLLLLLSWLKLHFIIIDHAFEIYAGAIALIFMALGIWLAVKITRPKVETITIEKEVFVKNDRDFVINQKELENLGISKRELEVLEHMALGLSNQEIAAKLFLSLNTVKTHSSKLFEKLDVKRRTQAVEKAKRLGLIS